MAAGVSGVFGFNLFAIRPINIAHVLVALTSKAHNKNKGCAIPSILVKPGRGMSFSKRAWLNLLHMAGL